MTTLWRILALAWLGGVASPILTDDANMRIAVFLEDAAAKTTPSVPTICATDTKPVEDETVQVGRGDVV